MDHYRHTNMSLEEANKLIDAFHDLYFLEKTDFRGVRHYAKEERGENIARGEENI